MNNETKLLKVSRPVVKVLTIVSLIATLAAVVLLICFLFAGVFTIYTDVGTKYENGFTYPGFQAIFGGYGNMIIQGYSETTFNIWTFLGLFLPLIGGIVGIVMLLKNFNRRGTNRKKAIVELVVAALLIFGGIILFNVDKFWIENAKNVTGSYTNYYEVYLLPAINGEILFDTEYYPTYVLVACLVAAVIKIFNGACLIFQKAYAKKLKNQAAVAVKE